MKIVAIRDDFKCAVLEPGDEALLFAAKKLAYTDENSDDLLTPLRARILENLNTEGPAYYREFLEYPYHADFVLLDGNDDVQGYAGLDWDEEDATADFEGAHIHSTLRGRHLVDLFYEARENHVRDNTTCRRMLLQTRPDNTASQRAAVRNGFERTTHASKNGDLTFEKHI